MTSTEPRPASPAPSRVDDFFQVSVERVIPAPPEAVFDLLVQPDRHAEIDGSGTLVKPRRTGRRVGLGDSFGMDMHWGVSYATRNVVTEFEQDRLIAWRTLVAQPLSRLFTGRTWRYELEPVEGGTRVRETWDVGTEALPARLVVRLALAGKTRANMERTLSRIEQAVCG